MKSEIRCDQETHDWMRIFGLGLAFVAFGALSVVVAPLQAQAPASTKGGPAKAKAAAGSARQTPATLAQLMKGILYPNSNVIFFAQGDNPADVPPAKDPATAVNPLASSYGKWEAVENSALAIEEAANLLTVPGRKCSNGVAVPVNNPDWPKLVQGLRDAGNAAYKAAQSKNQDKILDAADVMTNACANCHDKYREKPTPAERCK
jgi:cytochrome c556